MHHPTLRLAAFSLALLCANAHASCGSTACAINTNWDEHSQLGWRVDVATSYSRADTLRAGSSKISINPADPAYLGAEVENLRTINQLTSLTADYTYNEHWGVMLNLPYVQRDHSHSIGAATAPFATDSFTASALGDIKLVGRYRWALDENSGAGVKFGLKLNTGRKDFVLASGTLPNEATLQPGNGSTDLILGGFWQQHAPSSAWSYFAQGTVQTSLRSLPTFRPGNQLNLDLGTRYALGQSLNGLLQLNGQWNSADSGANAALTLAGATSSGGRSLALTPGLSYALTPNTQLYSLLQLPVAQYVNGEQLTAKRTLTLGISHRFD